MSELITALWQNAAIIDGHLKLSQKNVGMKNRVIANYGTVQNVKSENSEKKGIERYGKYDSETEKWTMSMSMISRRVVRILTTITLSSSQVQIN